MLRALAIIIGAVYILLGILGFIPAFVTNAKLFDLFRINFEQNVAHLATGIVSLLCGLISRFASRMFFMIAGIIYVFFALFGFRIGEGMLFEMFAVNFYSNLLHIGTGGLFLLIAYCLRK
jgi:hypothetical protein